MPPKAPPPMRGKRYSPGPNEPQRRPSGGKRIRFANIDPNSNVESQTCLLNSGSQPCNYILDNGNPCRLVTATCLLNMDFYRCGSWCSDKIERALEDGNIQPASATGRKSFCHYHMKKLTGLHLRLHPVKGTGLFATEPIPANSVVATFAMNPADYDNDLSKTDWHSPDPMVPGIITENSNHYGLQLNTDDDGILIDEFGTRSTQAGAALRRISGGGRATTLYFDDACERDLGDYANDYRNNIDPGQRNAQGHPCAGDLPDAYQWRGTFYPSVPATKAAKAKASAVVLAAMRAAAKGGAAQTRALSTARYDAGIPARYGKKNYKLPPDRRGKGVPLTANEAHSRANSPRSSRSPWCFYEAHDPHFEIMRLVYNVYPVEKRDGTLNIMRNNPGGIPHPDQRPRGPALGNIPFELFRNGVRYRDILVLVATQNIAANTFVEWDYGNEYWSSYFCPLNGDNGQECVYIRTIQNR